MNRYPRQGRSQTLGTPVRAALKAESSLQRLVRDGLGAVINVHRVHFDQDVRTSFADSLNADQALKEGREQENRWDYLLGHRTSKLIFGVEPHSAENSEIMAVIRKLEAAKRQLKDHLRDGVFVSKWFWVASGRVQFAPMEKAALRLAQNGIEFVGRKITSKHLD